MLRRSVPRFVHVSPRARWGPDRRAPFLPKLLPQIATTDKKLLALTKDKLPVLDLAGLPNITLTAGSNFGQENQPVWVLNVEANPEVEVTSDRRSVTR